MSRSQIGRPAVIFFEFIYRKRYPTQGRVSEKKTMPTIFIARFYLSVVFGVGCCSAISIAPPQTKYLSERDSYRLISFLFLFECHQFPCLSVIDLIVGKAENRQITDLPTDKYQSSKVNGYLSGNFLEQLPPLGDSDKRQILSNDA